jgi:hypothetical protein
LESRLASEMVCSPSWYSLYLLGGQVGLLSKLVQLYQLGEQVKKVQKKLGKIVVAKLEGFILTTFFLHGISMSK